MDTVIVTETLDPGCADWLGGRVKLVWCSHDKREELDRLLPDAAGLVVRTYTQVNDALLEKAPNLKVVGRAGVGLDNIDVEACRRRGVAVVYTPDANTQAVVEYVLGLMLDAHRPRTNLPDRADAATFHALRKSEVGGQLDRMTLGILGFGRIGKRIGAVGRALGMNLRVCDVLPESQVRKQVDYAFEFVNHAELYAKSDILTVHVDGRPENRQMIDAGVLALMRPHVLLINAARGMLVDHHAVAAWAKRNPDVRAVLDVHDPEPPGPDYPLWGLDNVRLLPHLASRTDEALKNMSWVVHDVWAVLQGRKPQYPA